MKSDAARAARRAAACVVAVYCLTATPAFGGEFLDRSKLTGDWGGLRSRLARNGVTLDADVTQFYQGVTSGGRKQTFEYGGHGDYVLNVSAVSGASGPIA